VKSAAEKSEAYHKPFVVWGRVGAGVRVKTNEVGGTIGRKPHVVVCGKRSGGHDQSKGGIGLQGKRHTK
jgi:hypothetical protein